MEKNAKKKKTLLIVGIVVAVLVVVYIICIATGNVKPAETENSSSGINQSETAVEPGASQNTTKMKKRHKKSLQKSRKASQKHTVLLCLLVTTPRELISRLVSIICRLFQAGETFPLAICIVAV